MKANSLVTVVVAVALCLILVATACAAPAKPAETEKTIKVGALLTLTGPIASWIGPGAPGIQDWYRYVNEQLGGIEYKDPTTGKTEKVKVELMWGDHAWDIARTISLYERFKAAGMQFVICHGSVPTTGIMGLASKDKIAGMSSNCTFEPSQYQMADPYIVANVDSMPENAAAVFMFVKKQLWKESRTLKVGTICLDAASRRPYDKPEGIAAFCKKNGMEYTGTEYTGMSPVDTSVELKRLADKGTDWVWLDNSSAALRVYVDDAIRLGLKGKMGFVLDWPVEGIIAKAPETFEGCYAGVCQAGLSEKDIPGIKLAWDIINKFRPGVDAEVSLGQLYLAGLTDGMVGTRILGDALSKAGYAGLTGTVIRDSAWQLKNIDTMGVKGPTFSVDPQYPLTHPYFRFCQVKGGKYVMDGSGFWETPPTLYKTRFNPNTPAGVNTKYSN